MFGADFENIESNDVFDIIINKYKEVGGFEDEPMDGDEVDFMTNEVSHIYNWNEDEKRKFNNYANIKEGNINPQDFDINLNEMENKEKDRMRKLSQSFEEKNEVFKEEREPTNSEKLEEDYKRLAELSSGKKNAGLRENQQGGVMGGGTEGGGYHGVNQGRTVTSIIDNLYSNPTQYQGAKGNSIMLKDNEALDVAIKRTLNSGAPVNDIAFYDEVNWHLAQLGFASKLPQDIKEAILKLMS